MTLWHRAPRAVYRVYDEDEYFAGTGEPSGDEPGPGSAQDAPASGLGRIDPALHGDLGAESAMYGTKGHREFAALSRGHNAVRLLAIGLLVGVTVSAASLVALELLGHSHPGLAPITAHLDTTHPDRPALVRTAPTATARTAGAAPAQPALASPEGPARRPAVVSLRHVGMPGRSGANPFKPPTEWPVGAADVTAWHTSESPPTTERQVDSEFGFERQAR